MKLVAILMMVLCSMLNTAGQYLFKAGAGSFYFDRRLSFFRHPKILLGLLLYVFSTALNVAAFKFADLIILYPLTNLSLVWNLALVKRIFGESVSPTRLLGTILIVVGCFVLVL